MTGAMYPRAGQFIKAFEFELPLLRPWPTGEKPKRERGRRTEQPTTARLHLGFSTFTTVHGWYMVLFDSDRCVDCVVWEVV